MTPNGQPSPERGESVRLVPAMMTVMLVVGAPQRRFGRAGHDQPRARPSQLEQAADATAQSALESVSSRIQAIIRSQSALHGLEGQLEVDLVKHLKRFVGDLTAGVGSAHELSFESRIASLTVPNDTALHVSLIVNELVTNAVKYAYPDEGGPVKVILRRRDDVYEILVQDKGGGFEGGKDAGRSGSLGLRLVQILAEGQLGGSWAVTADNGTTHAVQFAIPKE